MSDPAPLTIDATGDDTFHAGFSVDLAFNADGHTPPDLTTIGDALETALIPALNLLATTVLNAGEGAELTLTVGPATSTRHVERPAT